MREIRFRGITLDGEWKYGLLVKHMAYYFIQNNIGGNSVVMESSIGQFVGLLDKNGKEIYESDIVKLFYGHSTWIAMPFRVEFQNGAFALKQGDLLGSTSFAVYISDCVKEGVIEDTGNYDDVHALFEVIGNIHQNPDLCA